MPTYSSALSTSFLSRRFLPSAVCLCISLRIMQIPNQEPQVNNRCRELRFFKDSITLVVAERGCWSERRNSSWEYCRSSWELLCSSVAGTGREYRWDLTLQLTGTYIQWLGFAHCIEGADGFSVLCRSRYRCLQIGIRYQHRIRSERYFGTIRKTSLGKDSDSCSCVMYTLPIVLPGSSRSITMSGKEATHITPAAVIYSISSKYSRVEPNKPANLNDIDRSVKSDITHSAIPFYPDLSGMHELGSQCNYSRFRPLVKLRSREHSNAQNTTLRQFSRNRIITSHSNRTL